MARARNIKPGFFTNDVLAEVPALGRLLFAGLWTIADRDGRLEDRPRKIKAELLPYDDCDADALLSALAERGFILRYEADGVRYIQIVNWHKHQNPHVKEAPSAIPAPDEHQTSTVQAPDEHSASPMQAPEIPERAGLIPDSGFLIPKEPPCAKADAFARFWAAYPRKKSKGDAEKWFARHKPDEALLAAILDGIARARASPEWMREGGQFIPYPASWLNSKGWEDGGTTPAPDDWRRQLEETQP